jgi:hypothetical protein
MTKIRVLAAQASNWVIAFDPGLLRLRSALRILVTMVVSLALLAALTHIFGQPITVAMLGMMVSSMMTFISTIPGRRQQWITAPLLLLLALGAATLGTLLVPYQVLGILGFIAILFIAVYLRRFGQQGMLLGMTATRCISSWSPLARCNPQALRSRNSPGCSFHRHRHPLWFCHQYLLSPGSAGQAGGIKGARMAHSASLRSVLEACRSIRPLLPHGPVSPRPL